MDDHLGGTTHLNTRINHTAMPPSNKTIALVTGANKGLGRAIAAQLAKEHGYHVILGCRNPLAAEDLASELASAGHSAETLQLDLDSDESIEAAAAAISARHGRLDVLVNNAGIQLEEPAPGKQRPSTREVFSRTMGTNVVGTACLTEALLPLLRASASASVPSSPGPPRIVFVSSHLGSCTIGTDPSSMFYHADLQAYMASKAAVNRMALVYARMLSDIGGRVNLAAPGFVKTELTNFNPNGVTVEEGARRIVELATVGKDGPSFTFSDVNGPLPW
ncbi:short-chain dehydrogenase/reductase SDR [Magnaporthiopsis poae ATCC 64411]|uniref:Short-chain dehydrogenase/reductase SDR n=1 Tax=Magnaporthiopsis poae (strain ATCC 64411 / 73-15) TaxID=644358 RepID=A0A0C4EF23_MAGP6|nr:short-chain dehydrogenase/reductase SDR [Magnaporthiopsis poae ATCC 64411]